MIGATVTRVAFVITLVATACLALYPDLRLPSHWPAGEQSDRLYHVLAFASLSFLAGLAWRLCSVLVILLSSCALLLELAQAFSPGREPDGLDFAASLLGVTFGLSFAFAVNWLRQWRLRPT